jgi:glycosyltransferase involved in cell wall biosynthesis
MAQTPHVSAARSEGSSGFLLVIVPAFNEANQIDNLVRRVRQAAPEADILVVDDASTDATAERARRAGARVIRHCVNLGYGAAVQTGYKYAVAHGYAYLVQLDGDGQHDPADIPTLLEPVRRAECDVAIGSRFLGSGSYRVPWARRVGMRLFGAVASTLTRRRITDPTSGYQAMNRAVLDLYAHDIFPHDYPDADTIVLLHFAGFSMREVPVRMSPSPTGKSIHGGLIQPFYYIFKMFLSIFIFCISRGEIERWKHAS